MSNEEKIWEYLLGMTWNEYGTAAIMGNLMAESSLNPKCATGTKNPNYVTDAREGYVDFVHDGVAFGLAQWCYWSRKEGLLNLAWELGWQLDSLELQLKYLYQEMSQKYKSVWNAVKEAKDIRTPTEVIMLKYEKPANTSDAAKDKRVKYAQQFYDRYAKGEKTFERTVVATDNVNIRSGNGTNYPRIGLVSKGTRLPYVATADNGWYAVVFRKDVRWVSGEFSRIEVS